MNPPLFDTPVVLIFFIRPETFGRVFDAVRRIRPRQLFLIQDGPRKDHPQDREKIEACRRIAEQIDWECELHRDYALENLGCGLRISSGLNHVFEQVDRAIILEGDCVPEQSFFPYCESLLKRYEFDSRIAMISGFNHQVSTDCGGADYLFAKAGAIWGWATWRRVWELFDFNLRGVDDPRTMARFRAEIGHRRAARRMIKNLRVRRSQILTGITPTTWAMQWDFIKYTQNMLTIVPATNLICNIGIGKDSTHSAERLSLLPEPIARYFYSETSPIHLPPTAPPDMLCDRGYDLRYYNTICPALPVKVLRKQRYYLRLLSFKLTKKG